MVIKHPFTPETFLTLPRRGVIVPNETGTAGLYSVSTHEFGKGTKKEWRVMRLDTGTSTQLIEDDKVHDVNWFPGSNGTQVVWLKSADKGVTQLVLSDAEPSLESEVSYVVAEFDAPVQHLKLHALEDGSIAFALVGLIGEDGDLYNEATAAKAPSTARIYDTPRVREWDTYVKPQKYGIFYSKLVRGDDDKWFVASRLHNCLRDTDLEAPAGMYEPQGPEDNFDISHQGIVFVARDPIPSKLQYSDASDVYFVPVESWVDTMLYSPTNLTAESEPALGIASSPRFSPNGNMIAFLKSYYANQADTRLMMGHVSSLTSFDVFKFIISSPWELVPSSFEFTPNGEYFLITADDCGRRSLFELELRRDAKPKLLVRSPSVQGVSVLHDGSDDLQVLVSSSSIVESSVYTIVDTTQKLEPRVVSAVTKHGTKLGLSHSQVSDIWFEGSNESCVHAWVIKPSNFDKSKKYPVILQIHGGPMDATRDEWHWRWNSGLWAEQGYVVVAPNFTGSVGYGVPFSAGIFGEWGGRPYQDLVNCMHYLSKIPYIDMDRAVAAGGSYGGYMISWILGQPLAQKFKALICHDLCFDLRMTCLMSDETGGINDFGGPGFPWSNAETLEKWNPARPELLRTWKSAPPTLVIHSDKDFRCPVTDGLAMFRTLQGLGVPSRLLNFPDENHFVLNPENSLVWHQTVFDWIEKWVGKGPTECT